MVADGPQQAMSLQRRRRCTGTSCKHPITGESTPHISEKVLGEILSACTTVMEKLTISIPVVRLLEPDEAEQYLNLSDAELRKAGFLKLKRGAREEIWEKDSNPENMVSPQRKQLQAPRACESCNQHLEAARKKGKVLIWRYKILCRKGKEIGVIDSVILVD